MTTPITPNYLTIFNDHFLELVDDIVRVFPDDVDLLAAKNGLIFFKKSNPKLLIRVFNKYVIGKYKEQIINGDIEFFLNKDYQSDLTRSEFAEKIMSSIDRLRQPVRQMKKEDQQKVMQYIQNLQKLSEIYFSTNNTEI